MLVRDVCVILVGGSQGRADGAPSTRVVVELFGSVAPLPVDVFLRMCTGEMVRACTPRTQFQCTARCCYGLVYPLDSLLCLIVLTESPFTFTFS
jgi:hypothetical protein